MKRKNYIGNGILIVAISVILLIGMHHLPTLSIGSLQLRNIDMLSQLRDTPAAADTTEMAAATPPKHVKPAYVDSCPPGVTAICDYSTDNRGMTPLYEALSQVKQLNRPVRIAVLGDSYIEGDILTGKLREMLQKHFGGCGVGFVPMYNDSPGFRRTVLHSFNGWTEHSAVNHHSYSPQNSIISGTYFTPTDGAYTQLCGQKKYCTRLDTCQQASILLRSLADNTVTATINGHSETQHTIAASNSVQQVTVDGRIGKVRFSIAHGGDSVICYGVTMDPAAGVILDNYALRASSGEHIRAFSPQMLADLNRLRHYDLVILMYGLNVANASQTDYSVYRKKMCSAIAHMKENMPGTGFLVIGVGDRDETTNGEMHTLRGLKQLIAQQHRIATDSQVAFWNLFDAMGGAGSIAKMANSKPRMANLDYTHINHLGGQHLASLLYDALMAGYENYQRRLAYENE